MLERRSERQMRKIRNNWTALVAGRDQENLDRALQPAGFFHVSNVDVLGEGEG